MPKITQTHEIDINVERFLNACSPAELFDVDRLIQNKRYQDKISEMLNGALNEHAEEQKKVTQAKIGIPKAKLYYDVHPGEMLFCAERLEISYKSLNTVILEFEQIAKGHRFAFSECTVNTSHLIIMNVPLKKIAGLFEYISNPIWVEQKGINGFKIWPLITALSQESKDKIPLGASFDRRLDIYHASAIPTSPAY